MVHADLKPENILLKLNADQTDISQLKLIDFGSSFFAPTSEYGELQEFQSSQANSYQSGANITASTPEYLAPEVLNFIEKRRQ